MGGIIHLQTCSKLGGSILVVSTCVCLNVTTSVGVYIMTYMYNAIGSHVNETKKNHKILKIKTFENRKKVSGDMADR